MPIGNLSDLENFSIGDPLSSSGTPPTYNDSFSSRFGSTPNNSSGLTSAQLGGSTTPAPSLFSQIFGSGQNALTNMQNNQNAPDLLTGTQQSVAGTGAAAASSAWNSFSQSIPRLAIILLGLIFVISGLIMFKEPISAAVKNAAET